MMYSTFSGWLVVTTEVSRNINEPIALKGNILMETNEIDVMKNAATRLQDFLTTKGIKVQHAVALEALSASLGSRNWRTVRDKLSAPSAVTLDSLNGERYLVRFTHYGDTTPHSENFRGVEPLQAKIMALYQSVFKENHISILEVEDRLTGVVVDRTPMQVSDLYTQEVALIQVLHLTRNLLGPDKTIGTRTGNRWAALSAFVDKLLHALKSQELCSKIISFTYMMPSGVFDNDLQIGLTLFNGDFVMVYVANILEDLIDFLEDNEAKIPEKDKAAFYQVTEMVHFYSDKMSKIFVSHFRQS